jgi:hypothetical protein
MTPFNVDFKTVLVVLARSFCLIPDRLGPGIKSAVATRFINWVIQRWPKREIERAKMMITVIFRGAPVNQSRAGWKFFGSFMGSK